MKAKAKKKTAAVKPTTKVSKKSSTTAKQKNKPVAKKKTTVALSKSAKAAKKTTESKKKVTQPKTKKQDPTKTSPIALANDKGWHETIVNSPNVPVETPTETPLNSEAGDLHLIPEHDGTTHPVTPVESHKKEAIFHKKEEAALHQFNQKIKNAQPSRKTMKTFNRKRGM